jgi:tRNA(Arg) A34 adenosine deaminase TadA
MNEHIAHIQRCYQLADEAVAGGNHPFGALLMLDGVVVAAARNDAVMSRNPTRHAEMVLLADALPLVAADDRSRAVLYSSTEPCIMCAAAIYWSGISTVVYGCSAKALGRAAGGDFLAACHDVFARGSRKIEVIGPVLEEEGLAKHLVYWRRDAPPVASGGAV